MGKNLLITDLDEGQKEEKEKPKKKRKKRSFKLPAPAFLSNPKLQRVVGLSFMLFSAYMLIALTSFLFTWKQDQDVLFKPWTEILLNSEIRVENWLGKLGAILSHAFIHESFGVASFLFVALFFLIGFRILFKSHLLPFAAFSRIALFSLVWVSILLAYLFSFKYHFLGGTFGHQINDWLTASFGGLGTGILLFFTAFIFAVLNFNIPVERIKSLLNNIMAVEPAPQDSSEALESDASESKLIDEFDKEEETVVAEFETSEEETVGDEAEKAEEAADLELETNITEEEPQVEEEPEIELELPKAEEEPEEEKSEEDLELAIEETVKEELIDEDEAKAAQLVETQGSFDPKKELSSFKFPPVDLLVDRGEGKVQVNREELEKNKDNIVNTLKNYNIEISKIKATIGPTVTLYEIVPAPGARISKIINLEDDIASSLAALGIRIIAPIPGKGTIGIAVRNQNPDTVSMKTVIASEKFQKTDMELPLALGKTISNETYITDLAKMPHLLMAGATGQGKSVGLNAILVSLLYKRHPAEVKFVLVDPKKVELTLFNKIERHYLAKLPGEGEAIITDTTKVIHTLNSLCIEMDQRYEILKEAHARNIKEYNTKFLARKLNPKNGHRYLPYVVLVVDEFADLIMTAGKEVETPIARLAQLARAIGIHLIIATQRPSVNIITGTIKANFPSRIAFRVTAKIDSRTILDAGGADQLIGRGDMLLSTGSEVIRLQCAFVDTPEVEAITEFIGSQQAYPDAHLLPEYVDESGDGPGAIDLEDRDVLFEDAARVVVMHQQGSASLLQRKLKLGYNRAGRIVDQLEAAGIIGPFEGIKARQVLIPDEMSLEHILKGEDEA